MRMSLSFIRCLAIVTAAAFSRSLGAESRIAATMNAFWAQGIITGTIVKDGVDQWASNGVAYSQAWRLVKIDRWIYSLLQDYHPDSLKIPIYSDAKTLSSLDKGKPYLFYLTKIEDAPYPFAVSDSRPAKPLATAQSEVRIAEQVVKSGLRSSALNWGILEDTVSPVNDSAVLLNMQAQPLSIGEGNAYIDCRDGAEGFVSFKSIDGKGKTLEHTLWGGHIAPPLQVPAYGGVLLTGFQVKEANQSCGQGGLAKTGASLVFGPDAKSDTLVYSGPVGDVWVDGIVKGKVPPQALTVGGFRFDARGRLLRERRTDNLAIFSGYLPGNGRP
jgi:hypothetical protein